MLGGTANVYPLNYSIVNKANLKLVAQPMDLLSENKNIKFEATGFFRLEKADRWWLVTPEGNAYLSFGLNHAERKHLYRGYNRDFWIKKFAVIGIRHYQPLAGGKDQHGT